LGFSSQIHIVASYIGHSHLGMWLRLHENEKLYQEGWDKSVYTWYN